MGERGARRVEVSHRWGDFLMAALAETSFAAESGHWYAPDGSARYTVVGKNGKERNTTLRDARELGLYPSVTSILKIEAAPALENWKVNQALLSAMTLPRIEGENEDSFIKRALEDSRQQSRKASERGSNLHGMLELAVKYGDTDHVPPSDLPIIEPCLMWLDVNFSGYIWQPERSFACEHGFGGKLDLFGSNGEASVVIDWKFKDDIIPGKKLAYDNHSTQLGAYAFGLNRPKARCINLFISATVPGLIVPHEWEADEIVGGWNVFQHLLAIWKLRRGL